MRISVVTVRVPGNPDYSDYACRWLETYARFKPAIPHELIVVDDAVAAPFGLHGAHSDKFLVYTGGGRDGGIWQWLGKTADTDLLVCCNTHTYFWKEGWLERFVCEVEKHGVGLYGPTASYQVSAHLRGPCCVFQPEVMRLYPSLITNRTESYCFEHWYGKSLSYRCAAAGLKTMLVTWDGCYDVEDWRKLDNIYWRGDQSNVVVKDRHVDAYDAHSPEMKLFLSRLADGGSWP